MAEYARTVRVLQVSKAAIQDSNPVSTVSRAATLSRAVLNVRAPKVGAILGPALLHQGKAEVTLARDSRAEVILGSREAILARDSRAEVTLARDSRAEVTLARDSRAEVILGSREAILARDSRAEVTLARDSRAEVILGSREAILARDSRAEVTLPRDSRAEVILGSRVATLVHQDKAGAGSWAATQEPSRCSTAMLSSKATYAQEMRLWHLHYMAVKAADPEALSAKLQQLLLAGGSLQGLQ